MSSSTCALLDGHHQPRYSVNNAGALAIRSCSVICVPSVFTTVMLGIWSPTLRLSSFEPTILNSSLDTRNQIMPKAIVLHECQFPPSRNQLTAPSTTPAPTATSNIQVL